MSSDAGHGLVVVSGASGAGKSSLLQRLLAATPRLRFSVSHATRAPRPGEQDGVEYHFVDRARFEQLIREQAFLEWAEVHGDLKGTSRAELELARAAGVELLLDLDVQGAEQVRRRYPQAVTIFVLPPSFAELERRLRGRGQDSEEVVRRRLRNARDEMRRFAEYDFVVVNDDFERCVGDLVALVRAARLRRSRMEPVARQVLATFESQGEESQP
jgi:guanylate kinase